MKCPQCSSLDLRNRPRRNAFYPAGCVAVLGLPLAILHQASAPREYHCQACGVDFACRTKWARIAYVALIVLSVAMGLALLAGIIFVLRH
ncbi:MAG TPA: hypothetical protein VGO11_25800 [Chthoniobacteraceae bacterium]|nr:hypothetical protein [Chthoniobacteraceae bacterium]